MNLTFLAERYSEFWKYVVERQRVWYRRFVLKEPFPWSNDPILQKFHFCNNYRELDKGTIYLIDELAPYQNDRRKILFNVTAYRFFNCYGFFEKIGEIMNPDKYDAYFFIKKLDELIAKGEDIYNHAYVVCPYKIKPDYRPEDKHVQIAFILETLKEKLDRLIAEIDLASVPKESFIALKQIPAVGNFLAYEIWTDLTYFKFFKQGWTDNDFVNIGPGARWGLNILIGKDTQKPLFPEEKYLKLIYSLRDEMKEALAKLGLLEEWMKIAYQKAYSNFPFLSIRNIEHSLCEFRKYWRIKNRKFCRKRLFTLFKNLHKVGSIKQACCRYISISLDRYFSKSYERQRYFRKR
jgi:hypothetical protein